MSRPSLIPGSGPLTMSSREIAELTGKRHDNVMRDIRIMLTELFGEKGVLNFEDTHMNVQNGQSYSIFQLPKRECLILISGYSIEFRARIIDRWQALEAKAAGGNVHYLIPQTLPEALRLAADLAEKVDAQQRQIEADRPKVEFANDVAQAINCHSVEEVAKVLGTGRNRLFRWMRDNSVLIPDSRLPYQRFIEAGYFKLVERTWTDPHGEKHLSQTILVTGSGLQWLQRKFLRSASWAPF